MSSSSSMAGLTDCVRKLRWPVPAARTAMGRDSERPAIINRHAARGAHEAMTRTMDAQLETAQADHEEKEGNAAGARRRLTTFLRTREAYLRRPERMRGQSGW